MRENVITIPAMLFAILLLAVSLMGTVQAEDETEIKEFLPFTTGDYFEYDFDIESLLNDMVQNDEDFESYKDVTTKAKMTVKGTETVQVDSESKECWIIEFEMDMEYTLVDDEGNEYHNDMHMLEKEWWCTSTHATVKSEETEEAKMEISMAAGNRSGDDTLIIESVTVTVKEYTKIADEFPFPLKVGKTWSLDEEYTENTTTKSRDNIMGNMSDWEFEYEETSEVVTTNFEVISKNEVVAPAGNFTTLKIKGQEKGEAEYMFTYFDVNGMDVQEEAYDEDGTLAFIIKLKGYTFVSSTDTDSDGVVDIRDAFPGDASETADTDSDGVGDNGDAFPNDENETKDTDGDGMGDNADVFPSDANETVDTDGDGVGDNGDTFPNDKNESKDTDSDGVGDNADVFPSDANETVDADDDGVGDNGDKFPTDAAASADSDSDGYPDEWNTGKTGADSTTGLKIDEYPQDAKKYKKAEDSPGFGLVLVGVALLLGAVIISRRSGR